VDENISSIVDIADINFSSNSRTFFGLSLIISIVPDEDDALVVNNILLCVLPSSERKISNTQLTHRCYDIHSVYVPLSKRKSKI
jgi:hypothetical protein